MAIFKISLAIHLFAVTFWLGGMIILNRVMAIESRVIGTSAIKTWATRGFFGYIVPGAALALATGIFQISWMGPAYYFSQGWFHTKLTLVVILLIATIVSGVKITALKNNEVVKSATFMALHGLSALILVAAIFLTILGRSAVVGG